MRDFVLFDGGVKAARASGIKAAEICRDLGRHHLAHAGQRQNRHGVAGEVDFREQPQPLRVAIITTDRDELDKQIERVFTRVGETIYRTSSGRDDTSPAPGQANLRLLYSACPQVRSQRIDDFEAFIGKYGLNPADGLTRFSSSWMSAMNWR